MPSRSYDVAIMGAGVAGVISAYELARDHEVVVIDKGQVGAETTSRASGVVTTPAAYPKQPEMGNLAISFFESFDGTGVFSFHRRINIEPITARSEEVTHDLTSHDGIEYHDTSEVPGTDMDVFTTLSDYDGVLRFERTGMIDVPKFVISLKHEAERNGAEFRTDCAVERIRTDGRTIQGLDTEYGIIKAENVVCAAGWRTRRLLSDVVEIPTRPCRWNAILVDPEIPLSETYPMGQSSKEQFYWRPTLEGYLLVGGNEYPVDRPEEEPSRVEPAFREQVCRELSTTLRDLGDIHIVREDCCPTGGTATPDTMMILDAPPNTLDGLVVATGFQGIGVMSSPCVAAGVRSLVTGESCPFSLTPFALNRFDSPSADFEFVSGYNRYKF